MRDRLVAAFVGLTVVVVALYGIPRAYFLADLIRSQEQEQVERAVVAVAVAVDERRAAGSPVDGAFLDRLAEGDAIVVRDAQGATVASMGDPDEDSDPLWAEQPLADGGSVVVMRSGEVVGDDIAEALLPLVLVGLLLVALAGVVGVVIARRLSRPFQDLAEAARGLGSGDLQPDLPAYRVPEAQEISEALRTSGAKLDALLEHERELATRASHELRTPVTALRLELEDVAAWPETPESVAAQLRGSVAELDRLSLAITSLLESAREHLGGDAIDLDLDALVADVVARQGSHVTRSSTGVLPTHLEPLPVVTVLELLLDAVPGAVTVTTRSRGSHYEVLLDADLGSSSVWAQATEVAGSFGGQLSRNETGTVLRVPNRPLVGTKG